MKEDYEHLPHFLLDEVWRAFHLVKLAEKVLSLVSLTLMHLITKIARAC